ncbi:MAG: hypothetical protein ACI8QZ_002327 [Chlamydiales bacterium]
MLRIALGLIVFVDLALRATELGVLYTDGAAYPLERARQTLFAPIALHLASGSAWVQGGLMGLGMLFAGLLVVGYRTRLMTVLTWYLVISLHHRVYHIQDVGDQLLRLLLLWCVFLPLGSRYSLDARSRRSSATTVTSIASAGLLCQVALLYFFGALHKLKGVTWHTGDALEMVLQDDVWVRPLGALLGQVPWMTRTMTYGTVWAELLLPLLLLSPFAMRACRTVAIPLLLLFALGIGSCLHLGVIPWVITAALVSFLPKAVWDRVDRRLGVEQAGALRPGAVAPVSMGARVLRVVAFGVLPGILFVQLFTANIDSLRFPGRIPVWIKKVEFCLGLDQAWGMYAPDPVVSSFRLKLRLDLEDGQRVEVDFGSERDGWPETEAFEPFDDLWTSYRGRMLLDNIVYPELAADLRSFLVWACREWTSAHPERPVLSAGLSKEVRSVRPGTRAPGAMHSVLRTEPLLGHVCTDHP